MSTKIYEGRILKVKTLEGALIRIKQLRKEAQKLAEKEARELTIKKSIHNFINYSFGYFEDKDNLSPAWSANSEIREQIKKMKTNGGRNPDVDLELTISLLPIKKKILALPFFENNIYDGLLKKQDWIKDYSYWDNTDPPKNVSKKEWEQRRKDWNDAVPDRPCYDGLTAEIVTIDDYMIWGNAVVELMKETELNELFEKCLMYFIKNSNISSETNRMYKEKFGKSIWEDTDIGVSTWMEWHGKAVEWSNAEKIKQKILEENKETRKLFPEKITPKNSFNMDYKEIKRFENNKFYKEAK